MNLYLTIWLFYHVYMGSDDKEEKIPLSQVKKLPYKSLNRMIKKMREYLKQNQVVQDMFKEYKVDIAEIDFIPMMFGNLDVSAKTDHGIIIYNYKLLTDGDFFKDFSYGVHEMTHWLQQTTGSPVTGKIVVLVAIIFFLQWKPGGLFSTRSRTID